MQVVRCAQRAGREKPRRPKAATFARGGPAAAFSATRDAGRHARRGATPSGPQPRPASVGRRRGTGRATLLSQVIVCLRQCHYDAHGRTSARRAPRPSDAVRGVFTKKQATREPRREWGRCYNPACQSLRPRDAPFTAEQDSSAAPCRCCEGAAQAHAEATVAAVRQCAARCLCARTLHAKAAGVRRRVPRAHAAAHELPTRRWREAARE